MKCVILMYPHAPDLFFVPCSRQTLLLLKLCIAHGSMKTTPSKLMGRGRYPRQSPSLARPQARFRMLLCANDSIFVIVDEWQDISKIYMYEPEKHHWTCFKANEGRNEAKDCGRARHSVLRRRLIVFVRRYL